MKALLLVLAIAFAPPTHHAALTPQQVAQSLLDADRAFAKAASKTDMIGALASMFSDGVLMAAPPTGLVIGKAAVVATVSRQPDVATSHATWTPIRVGVSQDGQHGFSFGYFTMINADGARVPQKYMAYWVRENNSWRVMAYKRGRAVSAATDTAVMKAAIPATITAPITNAASITALRHALMKAESSFSDEAQRVGLGNAFATFGTDDAVNMGGPASPHFAVGANAIARFVSGGDMKASTVRWSADTALVASSGDLGITFGRIQSTGADASPGPGFPFFTIWRRANAQSPWRYVAE